MGVVPQNTVQYRYPGTKFFEYHQHHIFFGREQETADLIHSIKAHDVFVIFADSGIGKTSLLNAGLIPELEDENIQPVHLRFQDAHTPLLKTIAKKLSEYCPQPGLMGADESVKLWRLFKCCNFSKKVPLFVLDQFEEFFNHPKGEREACIAELADLVNDYLPDYIRDEMREKFREKDPTPAELTYYTPARVKMLFLIRADKLKLLDDLSKKIPLILRNRFHLKPLNTHQSEQAILRPASLSQNGFASPPFSFQPAAVTGISNYLKNEEGEVESFQLQILCRELEKGIVDRAARGEQNLIISEEDLGGEAGMDNITKNYYTNQLASIEDEGVKKKAVELIEDKLIVDERRISLPEVLLLSQGYSRELLDYLLNTTRLIRIDNDRYVEISHDRLLSSILKSRKQRVKEEERVRELEQLQKLEEEREQKNRELRKEKKIKDRFFFLTVVLAVLLVGLAFTFLRMMRSDARARIATLKYKLSEQVFEDSDSTTGDRRFSAFLNFYYRDSIRALEESVKAEKKLQDQYIAHSDSGGRALRTASSLLTRADTLLLAADSLVALATGINKKAFDSTRDALLQILGAGKLLQAREGYSKAQATGYRQDDELVLLGINEKMAYAFTQCLYAANVFLKAGDRSAATQAYQKGQQAFTLAADSTRPTAFNKEDVAYLNNLKKILKQ